jgi:glycerol-3-phosphate O-acyltransferase
LIELKRPVQIIDTRRKYDPILPGAEEWPVVRLSKNRRVFVEEVAGESFARIKKLRPSLEMLIDELETTRFRERMRLKNDPWKVDPEDEMPFWEEVKAELVAIQNAGSAEMDRRVDAVLKRIVERYSNEIAGNFKPSYYRLTRTIVTFFFSRLLNASRIKKFGAFWSQQYTLQDKIHITGMAGQLRKLARIGTIIMVPTHFSNIDSIVVGWVIHTLGLPPFIYGAGLNLFNIEIFAYFMNSLGAYKVDRRKKNLPYLETLRTYSSRALREGCHSLFFPGGTRSRSGGIEGKLKLGLLGTAIEAQRINYEQNSGGRESKIFVVPVTLNYHFVLEAPALIRDYLRAEGQERYYMEDDQYSTSSRILKFMIEFFTKGSNISVSIGRGMDLFGNYVDDEGMSVDRHGNRVNTRDYFTFGGRITTDAQREEEYTRMLSQLIVREFHRINRVFASHLVAYAAFRMLMKQHPKFDLYSLLRLPVEDIEIEYGEFRKVFDRLRDRVLELYNEGKLDIATHLTEDIDDVIGLGIENVGMYHSRRPLLKNRKGNIVTQDLNNLYYYHNRMEGYNLGKYV